MKYALIGLLALLFTGCAAQSPLEGEWKIVHLIQGGMDAQMEKYGSTAEMIFSGSDYTYRLTEFGKTREVKGTFTVKEASHEVVLRSNITGAPSESIYDYVLQGDKLTMTLRSSSETVMQLERKK